MVHNRNWIYKVNPTKYNIFGAYKVHKVLSWNAYNIKWELGDIVYMYISEPLQVIKYKCKVIDIFDTNKNKEKFIDDNEFVVSGDLNKETRFINLERLKCIDNNDISYNKLIELGYKSSRTPQTIEGIILKYINKNI